MSSSISTSLPDELVAANRRFAASADLVGLTMLPARQTIIVGCVDPRVDPSIVLGTDLGDALVIRNVGGRFTSNTLRTLSLLAVISRRQGGQPGDGWNLVVLQHTDCGIGLLGEHLDTLSAELGIAPQELGVDQLHDPR